MMRGAAQSVSPRPSPHTQQRGSGHRPGGHTQPLTATWGCATKGAWPLTHREVAQPLVLGREGPQAGRAPAAAGPEEATGRGLGFGQWDTGKAGRPFRPALAWSRHGLPPWCVCGPRTHLKQRLEGPRFPSPLSRPTEGAGISRVSLWGRRRGKEGFTRSDGTVGPPAVP